MSSVYLIGLGWILVAGVTQGAFVLPMKYTRAWKWEHLWFWYSVIAFFLLPLLVALVTVPHLTKVYSLAGHYPVALAALFGLGWGAGSVFFGLGVDALGMALGFSMMTGLYTALGAFIPLVLLTPELTFRRNGLMIIVGNFVTILGVIACAIAGDRRDKLLGKKVASGMIGPKRSFAVALAICILSGVLSAALNFGYAFASGIMKAAESLGATKEGAVNAMWLILIPAGGLLNVGYCTYLLAKNKSWDRLVGQATGVDWLGASIMGILWTGSVIVYGWGANDLGRLGPSLGWSLWNAILIATTFVCGILTHEWDGVRGRPSQLLITGIGLLIVGMFVLGMGV
jgi:L-rhamnose-H+ transport protein